jgi:hypothetical protein
VNKKVLFVVLSTIITGSAFAQPSKFQGVFGQIVLGDESVDPSHASSTLSVNGRNTGTNGLSNYNVLIGVGYKF